MAEPLLRLEGLEKSFDGTRVLGGVSLSVDAGEFVTLLGPSGCGKTTTLRIIAGLTPPDAGRVWLEGRDITLLPPERRDVNTVFQSYALFPHMNVEKNIAYGLRVRGTPQRERRERVREMLRLVRLEGFERRMPSQLSGGQRQRVAIARAVVLGPRLLLLDEPLGALDLKLRQQMQGELKEIQRTLGIAFVYITHDQEEALNMSDRIAVMREGRIEQVGAPQDVYERPRTQFVAAFIGQTNFLPCRVEDVSGDALTLSYGGASFPARRDGLDIAMGERALLCLRAERLTVSDAPAGPCAVRGTLGELRYAGGAVRARIALNGGIDLHAQCPSMASVAVAAGQPAWVSWDPALAAVVREDAHG